MSGIDHGDTTNEENLGVYNTSTSATTSLVVAEDIHDPGNEWRVGIGSDKGHGDESAEG